jgi:hypothetical protein
MTRQILLMGFISGLLGLFGCNSNANEHSNKKEFNQNSHDTGFTPANNPIDTAKRNKLVAKYDLLKFPNIKQPILLTVDEFFDGNGDEASIAPNLSVKPRMTEYCSILKNLADNPKTTAAFAEIKEVMIYDGKLNDNEWFYSDIIYFVGDLTKEEIKAATISLMPDEVEYDNEDRIKVLSEKYADKNVVYVWWD